MRQRVSDRLCARQLLRLQLVDAVPGDRVAAGQISVTAVTGPVLREERDMLVSI